MTDTPSPSLPRRLMRQLDNTYSPLYMTLALLFYIVPVILVSMLFIGASANTRFDSAYIALFWVAIVILPLMLTFGVFLVYRANYTVKHHQDSPFEDQPQPSEGLKAGVGAAVKYYDDGMQWDKVINKALDWRRFLMPMCLLNMFLTLAFGFLLFADISSTRTVEGIARNEIIFGYYDLQLFFGEDLIIIPASLFYAGLFGFMTQFLEMTRRRYVSRNLVPRFYLTSTFRLLQVIIIVVVAYFFLQTLIADAYMTLIVAFIVGMFPVQLLAPVVDGARQRLGMSTPKKLSITLVNGIDNTLESLLQEENIDSIQILATMKLSELRRRTAVPEETLKSWQNQAKLFNVLGTEELVHRFKRVGINDFDDLLVLVDNWKYSTHIHNSFGTDFTTVMKPKSLDKAMEDDSYWHILMQVLIGEYVKAFPEAIHKLKPDVPESDVLENDVPKPELSIAN